MDENEGNEKNANRKKKRTPLLQERQKRLARNAESHF
jgi:hypothetical protein